MKTSKKRREQTRAAVERFKQTNPERWKEICNTASKKYRDKKRREQLERNDEQSSN